MSFLAMSMCEGTVSRYRNRYFPRSQIQDPFQQAQNDRVDFYSGLFSPAPCPPKDNKKRISRDEALEEDLACR